MPTIGFSVKPLKVKLFAGEQKATELFFVGLRESKRNTEAMLCCGGLSQKQTHPEEGIPGWDFCIYIYIYTYIHISVLGLVMQTLVYHIPSCFRGVKRTLKNVCLYIYVHARVVPIYQPE